MNIEQVEVYFDDSGCNPKYESVFMWAGYLARLSDWSRFSREWRAVLDSEPRLEFWRQASARKRETQPFASHSSDELEKRERQLAQVIERYLRELQGFVIRLPWTYCDRFVKGKVMYGRTMSKRQRRELGIDAIERPQVICFVLAAQLAAERVKEWGAGTRLNFTCEAAEGNSYEVLLSRAWDVLKRSNAEFGRIAGSLSFIPGKSGQIPPLEAADMLAWHVGKRSSRCGTDDPMWKHLHLLSLTELPVLPPHLIKYVGWYNALEADIRRLFHEG